MCFHRVHTSLVCFSRCAFTPCTHTWASVYCVRFICLDIRFKVVERQYRTSLGARASPTPSPIDWSRDPKTEEQINTPPNLRMCHRHVEPRVCASARASQSRAYPYRIYFTVYRMEPIPVPTPCDQHTRECDDFCSVENKNKPFMLDRCPSAFISAVDPPPPQSASLSYRTICIREVTEPALRAEHSALGSRLLPITVVV